VMICMAVATGKALLEEQEMIVHGRRRRFKKSIVDEVRSEVHGFQDEVHDIAHDEGKHQR
ncbi:hypothetical protein, partial [Pseudomonas sp. AH2 (2023)]|uniref:hypothetical protein n=1 Tax=Pseudomonas sp. AH2 (2023) TaxID=3048599 RepID=UPI002B23E562